METKYIVKKNKKFYTVIFSLFIAGFLNFFMLYFSQPILSFFSKIFFLSPLESSYSLSSSTASMAIGTLFASFFSDIFGRKKFILLSLLFSIIFTFFSIFSRSWLELIFFRTIIGLFLSGITPTALIYLSEELHPKLVPYSINIYVIGSIFGGFFGRFFSSLLIQYFSWKLIFFFIGLLSLILFFVIYYFLPKSKNFFKKNKNFFSLIKSFSYQIKKKRFIFLYLIGFFTMGTFVSIFNYINYRLSLSPLHTNSKLMISLSFIYLLGIYFSKISNILIKKYGIYKNLFISLIMMILGLFFTFWDILILIFLGLCIFSSGFFLCHAMMSRIISDYSFMYQTPIAPLYFFFYYIGASFLGTLGGYIWFEYDWSGLIIFFSIILMINILFVFKIKKYLK